MENPMKRYRILSAFLVLTLAALACSSIPGLPGQPTQAPGSTTIPLPTSGPGLVSALPAGPVKITGTFNYSNDIITTYFAQQAVALTDMHGFVTRDLEWEIPVESQTLGFLDINPETKVGTYFIDLPAKPEGTFDDVDNNGSANAGVQIFAVAYSPNLTGGPYSEGDDPSFGWPTYLASVKADSENKDEVIGGKLVVWSPDNEQQFPTGFGDDGLLFTADDPVGPIPAGYSIVDLDQTPFDVSQEVEPQVELYEPKEAAIKDYSGLSYTKAFDELFKSVSTNWAFNGAPGKEVDWTALHDELAPRVAQAEKDKNTLAFYQAIHDFTLAIPDGHTGVSGGDLGQQDFQAKAEGGYGFAVRELDDGRVIVVFVTPGGPAEAAGMTVGAEVTEFNDQPIKVVIGKVKPYSGPFSLESSRRYQQTRYLLRSPLGVDAKITFTNPNGKPQTVTLTSVSERDSFLATSIYRNAPNSLLPVDYRVLDSGVGYIAVNSYYDDLSLIITLFERALKQFQGGGVTNLIIDLRYNGGGNPLGLAGFLYDQEIPLGQQESYSEQTGQFEPVGVRDRVLPNKEQYRFDKIAILVSPACASACDQEAYSFSQVPGAMVVGMYPSAGIFADVLRGQYVLPEGLSLQIPTTRMTNPDGSLFLEGTGVQPTVKVPITEATVLATDDVELKAAEDAILGVSPDDVKIEGGPTLGSPASTKTAVEASTPFLEQQAQEQYTAQELAKIGGTFTYTVNLDSDARLVWYYGWCATSRVILNQNYEHLKFEFSINGQPVDLDKFYIAESALSGLFCKSYYVVAFHWPSGETKLQTVVTFDEKINDGTADYEAGTQTFDYTVTLP